MAMASAAAARRGCALTVGSFFWSDGQSGFCSAVGSVFGARERVEQCSSGAITVLLLVVRNVANRPNFRVEMCIRSEKNTVDCQLFLGKIHLA